MKPIHFLLSCLLVFNTSVAQDTPRIFLVEATPNEASEIQLRIISFYAEELLQVGLCENYEQSIQAAREECTSENVNPRHYYHLLLHDAKTPLGYLVYSINEQSAYLDAIYLEELYRGKGLGKQILQELESQLLTRDIRTIRLYVFAHNEAAYTLYIKAGYSIENAYSDGDTLIGYLLRKEF